MFFEEGGKKIKERERLLFIIITVDLKDLFLKADDRK